MKERQKVARALIKARKILLSCNTVAQLVSARNYIMLCRKMIHFKDYDNHDDYLKARLEIGNLLSDSFLLEKKLMR